FCLRRNDVGLQWTILEYFSHLWFFDRFGNGIIKIRKVESGTIFSYPAS
ncbi:hypothetical protein A2U01_0114938, partial [Trifolium medium]|nr:hypothetical protein [Trifolium medium]